jgi:hypothetical protein
MSDFSDIGKLMHLPIEDIKPGEPTTAPSFMISAAAEALVAAGGRNWVPLVVKQTGKYEYQVVSESFIHAVAEQAGLDRIWSIVIDSDPQTVELAKVLAGEVVPKVNLSTASRDTIKNALQYLIEKPGSPLRTVSLLIAVDKLDEANRQSWKTFEPIARLKCGITKAKLSALEEVFYLAPVEEVPPPPPPEPISIKKASRDEIFERLQYLAEYKIDGFEKVNADKVADILFTTSKGKWKSLNPISTLDCGISKAKIKTLKLVFTL